VAGRTVQGQSPRDWPHAKKVGQRVSETSKISAAMRAAAGRDATTCVWRHPRMRRVFL
jgi:hypothetical protein